MFPFHCPFLARDILLAVNGGASHRPVLLNWVFAGVHSTTAVGVGISERSPVRVLVDCWQCRSERRSASFVMTRRRSRLEPPHYRYSYPHRVRTRRFGSGGTETRRRQIRSYLLGVALGRARRGFLPLCCLVCWLYSSDTQKTAGISVTVSHPKTALYPRPEGRGFNSCNEKKPHYLTLQPVVSSTSIVTLWNSLWNNMFG